MRHVDDDVVRLAVVGLEAVVLELRSEAKLRCHEKIVGSRAASS